MAALGNIPVVTVLLFLGVSISSLWVEATSDVCLEPYVPGECTGPSVGYMFDVSTKTCILRLLTFCPENKNYFIFREECLQKCSAHIVNTTVRESDKCLEELLPGICVGERQVVNFNAIQKKCVLTSVSTCPHSGNIFESMDDCGRICAIHMPSPPTTTTTTTTTTPLPPTTTTTTPSPPKTTTTTKDDNDGNHHHHHHHFHKFEVFIDLLRK